MSKLLKPVLLVHMVVALILGALLLLIPGKFLGAIGWAPVDPIISRILGAALLAMAWGNFRLWRGGTPAETRLWVEFGLAFDGLAAIGVLRHLVVGRWPAMVWILFVVLALFALVWALIWRTLRR
jgi:hypothetical protein